MVNKHEKDDVELDVTNDEDMKIDDIELEDLEEKGADKIKKLKAQIKEGEEERRKLQDDLQRTKAEFLNARKRIDEERANDKIRHKKKHVEELLPLCDSFNMAMSNKEAWEKADEAWRKGVEGISSQLDRIVASYGVTAVNPEGDAFDPNIHEAVGTTPTDLKEMDHKVVSVLQPGYVITEGDRTEIVRPARVIIGEYTD
jgi:molecular chaperone GrpE